MPIARLHPGPVISYPGLVGGAATIVGASPQWDDASDATYAVSDTDPSGSPSFTAPIAPLDILTPAATTILSATIYVRYSTAYPDGVPPSEGRAFSYGIFEPDGSDYARVYSPRTGQPGQPTIPDDDGVHEFTWVFWPNALLGEPYNTFVGSELLRVFKSGSHVNFGTVVPSAPDAFVQSSVTIFETWVEVEYAGQPVLRQLHRRDGLGQASVGRLGAATNSVRRVIGGQP